jgi:hypothetical protein
MIHQNKPTKQKPQKEEFRVLKGYVDSKQRAFTSRCAVSRSIHRAETAHDSVYMFKRGRVIK